MYKVEKGEIKEIGRRKLVDLDKVEGDLQDWIISNPGILADEILLIGSHIRVADVNDELDLLGADVEGNLVIIELKRGRTPSSTDFQALKYCSYISNWNRDEIEKQFKQFSNGEGKELYKNRDFANFNELLEDFCDEGYSLNENQRIMIVAGKISQKIGSVLIWLENQNIDVLGIEVRAYKSGEDVFLEPDKIIPAPTYDRFKVGEKREEKKWKKDGREWHLENRCSEQTKEDVKKIINFVEENFAEELEGPVYGQKHYIAFKLGRRNVLAINTHARQTNLDFHFKKEDLEKFEEEELKSRLEAMEITTRSRYFRVKVSADYDIPEEQFVEMLKASINSMSS